MTITAKIIADSINNIGIRITTFELEYPRFIHAEVMTHRMFSRNSASSRAIPVAKVIEQVKNNPATPIHWGRNQAGMQAHEELQAASKSVAKYTWAKAAESMADFARDLTKCELHKQVVNRILEPFQTMKVVVTATEWNNFWWLRDHIDAQPEIQKLARVMKAVYEHSKPELLDRDMWHLPYVKTSIEEFEQAIVRKQHYFDEHDNEITLEQAIKISCSSCAQVSYRKLDTSLEKAEDIYKKLVESEPVHASAFEHVAKCVSTDLHQWHDGMTHQDVEGYMWSGNFREWVQYRQLVPNNAKKG